MWERAWTRASEWGIEHARVARATDRGSRERRARANRSRQPPLAASVVLHVAERLTPRRRQPEVELLHVLVLRELGRRAIHHDAAGLENVAVVGEAQRDVGVLLGQEEAHRLVAIQVAHDLEDLLDDLR